MQKWRSLLPAPCWVYSSLTVALPCSADIKWAGLWWPHGRTSRWIAHAASQKAGRQAESKCRPMKVSIYDTRTRSGSIPCRCFAPQKAKTEWTWEWAAARCSRRHRVILVRRFFYSTVAWWRWSLSWEWLGWARADQSPSLWRNRLHGCALPTHATSVN